MRIHAVAATVPNALRLRPARSSDLASLTEIVNHEIETSTASWSETPRSQEYMAKWVVDRTGSGYPVFVAEQADEVIGVAGYTAFRNGDGYRFTVEHSVYVRPGHRRKGVATGLVQRLIEQAKADGLHRMVGGISADQEGSLGLHQKLGFQEVGRLSQVGFKFERWLDLVFMVREL
ncbi:MAG: N-acetyltransferase family protein [Pseudomonadota bacterium]